MLVLKRPRINHGDGRVEDRSAERSPHICVLRPPFQQSIGVLACVAINSLEPRRWRLVDVDPRHGLARVGCVGCFGPSRFDATDGVVEQDDLGGARDTLQ